MQLKQVEFAITVIADNNPVAVSKRLFELGILPEQVELNSDQVVEALTELWNNQRADLLRQAIKVPFNDQAGNYTVKLKPYLIQTLNK